MAPIGKRIDWIDTARGIGLLLVFLGHMRVPYLSAWIYTFHMPLFFFLSGMLYPGCEKYSFSEFAWRRFKGLVIPYFALGAVIALFYCAVYFYYDRPQATYVNMVRSFLIQEHYWTIWFLAALYLTQIIYYCVDKCVNRWRYASFVLSSAICVFGLLRYRMGWGSLPWNLDIAFIAQFFFHVGYRFMHNHRVLEFFTGEISSMKRIGIIVLCFVVNYVAGKACIVLSNQSLDMSIGMYGNEALSMISAFAGILAVLALSPVIHSAFLTYLGRNTMILFSWHSRIVLVLCGMVYAHYGLFQSQALGIEVLRALTSLIVILLVLVPVNEFIKRLPCHKVFGV